MFGVLDLGSTFVFGGQLDLVFKGDDLKDGIDLSVLDIVDLTLKFGLLSSFLVFYMLSCPVGIWWCYCQNVTLRYFFEKIYL